MKKIFTMMAGVLLAGGFAAHADQVTCQYYEGSKKAGKSLKTELTKEAGVYTLENILQSGVGLQFTFTPAEEGEKAEMVFEGEGIHNNLDMYDEGSYGYFYILTEDDEDIEGLIDAESGDPQDDIIIYYPFFYTGSYATVTTNAGDSKYDYMISMCFTGYDEEDEDLPYYYMYVYFNEIEEGGVENVIGANDAAAEYFNLQGVRVAEPADGIFIRRQGNDVKKVVIR